MSYPMYAIDHLLRRMFVAAAAKVIVFPFVVGCEALLWIAKRWPTAAGYGPRGKSGSLMP